jgi:hypothetical protein
MISFDAGGKWENLDGLGEEILQELKGKGEGLMMTAGTLAVAEVKNTLTGTRSGTPYFVPGTERLHVGAAEGEPPAVLHGHLRNSVGHSRPAWSGWEISFEYGPGLGVSKEGDVKGYAVRMEYGGESVMPRTVTVRFPDGWRVIKAGTVSRTRAHPYMQPSADRLEPILEKMFEDGL